MQHFHILLYFYVKYSIKLIEDKCDSWENFSDLLLLEDKKNIPKIYQRNISDEGFHMVSQIHKIRWEQGY